MIELIPAIDIIDGKCVRLSQGDYDKVKEYSASPADVAKEMEDHGITRLHVVGLDGAKSKHVVNWRTLEQIANETSLVIDFGGGVKTDDDLRIVFECGAQMVTGGSVAVKEPATFQRWLCTYGPESYTQQGVQKVICTEISRDGMLQGPAISLYKDILAQLPNLYLIASGGVSSMADIEALAEANIPGVIFGKALYEGQISWQDIERFIINKPY